MANEYKHMGEFINDDQELLGLLKKNNCKAEGKKIRVQYSGSAFQILADLAAGGYRLYNPSLLALAWGISRQAVNNVINRGLLVTIEFNGGFSVEYKYIVFEPVEAQGERAKRRSATPETYFGATTHPSRTAAGPIRDAAGLIQEELPLSAPESFEGLTATEIKERDSICNEWRGCSFRGTCFDQAVNWDCICQKDEDLVPNPDVAPPARPSLEDLREARSKTLESLVTIQRKIEKIKPFDWKDAGRGVIVEAQESKRQADVRASIEDLRSRGFHRDEIKILRAGFSLVRYNREEKTISETWDDPILGWYLVDSYNTYAAAERKLAEIVQDPAIVQVSLDGKGVYSGRDENKLQKAGFDFYRVEDPAFNDSYPRIKSRSSGWGTFKRFEKGDNVGVRSAFADLMENDEKALEG